MMRACSCPSLRDATDWVELWRRACYPLSLSNAVIYCDLRVVLFRWRCVESSLRLSRIEHWTRIYKALFANQCGRIETSRYGQLIHHRPCHCRRMSHRFGLVGVIVLTARWTVMWVAFFNDRAVHLFLQLIIGDRVSWVIAAVFID